MPFRVQPCKSLTGQRLPAERSHGADEPEGRPSRNFYSWCAILHSGLALTLVMASATTLRPVQWNVTAEPVNAPGAGRSRATGGRLAGERLGITAVVTVTDGRARRIGRVSVRREPRAPASFALSVERGFVEGLTAAQLEAALAHELGHVWIYTHHPYVQTEQLANRIAMRVVPRRELVAVYSVLWGADAVHGSPRGLPRPRGDHGRAGLAVESCATSVP